MLGNARLKESYFDAKIEVATLELKVKSLEDELALVRSGYSQSVEYRDEQIARLQEQVQEVLDLRVKNAVLMERLDLLANHLPPAPTEAFSTLSEETEDAEYALRAGLIDRDEYEAILASAGALNTEITFDSATLSHL